MSQYLLIAIAVLIAAAIGEGYLLKRQIVDNGQLTATIQQQKDSLLAQQEQMAKQRLEGEHVNQIGNDYETLRLQLEKNNESLRRNVANGAVRLSIPTDCKDRVPSPHSTPGEPDGAERVELPATLVNDLLQLGLDADQNTAQLTQLQAHERVITHAP